jgi:hypothetical protein
MDVRGVGAGPAPVDPGSAIRGPVAPKTPAAVPQPGADMLAGLLRELNETELGKLLASIERPPFPESASRVHEMARLVAEGKVTLALERLAEFAPLDPQRAEVLPAEPAFAPVRAQAETVLLRLTAAARLEAHARVAHALQIDSPEVPSAQVRTESVAHFANRLIEAGGYANAITAMQLAELLIERRPPGNAISAKPALPWPLWRERTRRLWRRAPLLVLLLGWLVFGLCGCLLLMLLASSLAASAFEYWGLGFLVLVAFGFYMRIRHVRF